MPDWLQNSLGWIVAALIAAVGGGWALLDRMMGWGKYRSLAIKSEQDHADKLADHEFRIRSLESNNAEMRTDVAVIKSSIKNIEAGIEELKRRPQ